MSALTKTQLADETRCKDAIKALPEGARRWIIAHLANLQTVELERLIEQSDLVRIHRAQGAVSTYQSVIELLADRS